MPCHQSKKQYGQIRVWILILVSMIAGCTSTNPTRQAALNSADRLAAALLTPVVLGAVALAGYGTFMGFKAIKNSLSFCKEKDYGCYIGQVAEGKPHGLGAAQTRPDVTLPVYVYAGEWNYGLRHGMGRHEFGEDLTYVGGWSNGKKHGPGILWSRPPIPWETRPLSRWIRDKRFPRTAQPGLWINGSAVGSFVKLKEVDDYIGNDGFLSKKGGYLGPFSQGERHGEAFSWDENGSYFGQWKKGSLLGNVSTVWRNGAFYRGAWDNGAPHGAGTLTLEGGGQISGEWIQGVLEEGTFILADRTKYNGKWVPFKVINGELHDIDSSSLISTFILNGEGVIYGENGVIREEKWKQFPYASQKSDAPMVDFTNVLVVSSCKTESSDNRSANCVLERRFDEKQHSNPKRFSLVAAHHN